MRSVRWCRSGVQHSMWTARRAWRCHCCGCLIVFSRFKRKTMETAEDREDSVYLQLLDAGDVCFIFCVVR